MPCLRTMYAIAFAAFLGTVGPTFAVHAQAAPKAAVPSIDNLVHYFDAIVFGARTDGKPIDGIIVKWTKETLTLALEEPHAKIEPAQRQKFLAMVKTHLAELTRLTGRKFAGTNDPASADIRIFFVRRADMDKIYGPDIDPQAVKAGAATGECYSIRWRKTPSAIFKTLVVLNVDRDPALVNNCMLRELTHGMGLPLDSDALRPSIFSKADHLTELSPQDQALVRTLYDARMTPGMPRAEALKVARTIITEMKKPSK